MKQVLLVISQALDEAIEFDTVKEAQDHAATQTYDNFNIYTMYLSGIRGGIDWKLQTGHSTNIREITKSAATAKEKPLRAGKFTQTEIDTVRTNIEKGISVANIAKALNRSYNSVYTKAKDKGFVKVKSKKK